eukprot:3276785-Alexandrium_andersonii.AAC.1
MDARLPDDAMLLSYAVLPPVYEVHESDGAAASSQDSEAHDGDATPRGEGDDDAQPERMEDAAD